MDADEPMWGGGAAEAVDMEVAEPAQGGRPMLGDQERGPKAYAADGTLQLAFVDSRSQRYAHPRLELLPTELLLMIFEWLLAVDPITLLGTIPRVSTRFRAIAPRTLDTNRKPKAFDFRDIVRIDVALSRYKSSPVLMTLAMRFPHIKSLVSFMVPKHAHGRVRGRMKLRNCWDPTQSFVTALKASGYGPDIEWHNGNGNILVEAKQLFERYPEIQMAAKRVVEELSNEDRINMMTFGGKTPLAIAVQYNSLAAVKYLLGRGAEIDVLVRDVWVNGYNYDTTLLSVACFRGNKEIVTALLDGPRCNIDYRNRDGRTALHEVSYEGIPEMVDLLVRRGARIDCPDRDGVSPLGLVFMNRGLPFDRSAQCAEILLLLGASINFQNGRGRTPLANACVFGMPEVVGFYLEKGASVDIADFDGRTPLALACKYEEPLCLDVVNALFTFGVRVDVSALARVIRNVVDFPERKVGALYEKYLALEARVVGQLKTQQLPDAVFVACLQQPFLQDYPHCEDRFRFLTRLIEHGTKPDGTNFIGANTLSYELSNAAEEMVRTGYKHRDLEFLGFLIESGADPNKILDGETPLTRAVKTFNDRESYGTFAGLYMVYKHLVNHGANQDKPNVDGKTPPQLVAEIDRVSKDRLELFLSKIKHPLPLPDWK